MTDSSNLPGWAQSIMDGWRNPPSPWVSIDDDLDHRREAFYRLYLADDLNVRSMWVELDERLASDERGAFIHTIILATDENIKNEPLPVYSLPSPPAPRLRTRVKRLARKFAEQLQLLRVCTPPRCAAKEIVNRQSSSIVEALVIYFDIGEVYQDYDQRWRLTSLGIEYTTSSKRGWVQHRRASDTIRRKVIEVGHLLINEIKVTGQCFHFADELSWFVSRMEQLPDLRSEHGDELILASQKSGYLDWFRYTYREALSASNVQGISPLSHAGWATLAGIITGDPDINPDDIAHAVRAWQKS